jgi:hypothetical protein
LNIPASTFNGLQFQEDAPQGCSSWKKNTREAMLETSADYRPFFPAVQKGINIEENQGLTPPFSPPPKKNKKFLDKFSIVLPVIGNRR